MPRSLEVRLEPRGRAVKIVDISLPLGERTPVYEGDPPFRADRIAEASAAVPGSYNLSLLKIPSHLGTHLDPPLHFVPNGLSAGNVPLEILCGSARVVDLRGQGPRLGADVLRALELSGVERLLLKTDNGPLLERTFTRDYVSLTVDAAIFLRDETCVRLVGIDYLSIEPMDSPGYPVHRTLLEAQPPILILEGIDLRHVEPDDYQLFCLPLRLIAGDGGPARAVLVSG
jgi:arylformamidase